MDRLLSPALRYRRVEAILTCGLCALICAAALFAPWCQRSIVQSVLNTRLAEGSAPDTGIRLAATPPEGGYPLDDPRNLVALLPRGLLPLFQKPIAQVTLDATLEPLTPTSPQGHLVWRDGMCAHVQVTSGRCPTAPHEVLASAAEAERRDWQVGTTVGVHEDVGDVDAQLTVVGLYRQLPGPFWFGVELSGGSAVTSPPAMDDLLTGYDTMAVGGSNPKGAPAPWSSPVGQLDLPIRASQVDVADLVRHRDELAGFILTPDPAGPTPGVPVVTASSGLLDITRSLQVEQEQSRVTVPLLMAQLVLVLTCVLWLVLVALTEQRRGELALARLRGRSPSLSRMLLLRESRPPVVAGMVAGAVLALTASYAARHWWLDHDPSIAVQPSDAAWFAGAVALVVTLAVLSVRRPAAQPISALLRAVPARARGFVLGTLEAVVVALGGAGYVAVLTGQLHGAVAGTIPAALAAASGVAGARLVAPVFAALGRRALRRGDAVAAAARLEAARRPTARWLVPVTALATASLVFGVTAEQIGSNNRARAAAVDNGSPLAARVSGRDVLALRQVVAAVDPGGRQVTPVVLLASRVPGGPTTVGVVPEGYRRVAGLLGDDATTPAWDRLVAPVAKPVTMSGRYLSAHVVTSGLTGKASPGTTFAISLAVLATDGSKTAVELFEVPLDRPSTQDVKVYVPCAEGCRLTGISASTPSTADGLGATVALTRVTLDGRPQSLGDGGSWLSLDTPPVRLTPVPTADGMRITIANAGRGTVTATTAAAESNPPALATPAAAARVRDGLLAGTGIDGSAVSMRPVGSILAIPGAPPGSIVVNIDALLSDTALLNANGRAEVLFARDDSALLAKVRTALATRGITVTEVTRAAGVRRAYARTAPAWSLRLAVGTAMLSLLVALMGLVVLIANSRRGRSWDLASLRLAGMTGRDVRRIAVREIVPLALAGTLVGVVAGVLGGLSVMSTLPLFPEAPAPGIVDLSPSWWGVGAATLLAVVPVVLVAGAMASWTTRRSGLSRLRDPG